MYIVQTKVIEKRNNKPFQEWDFEDMLNSVAGTGSWWEWEVKRVKKKIGYAEEKSMMKVRLYCVGIRL